MKVIAIVAQKGGTGKTTLTISLATAAFRAGKTAAIVDLDPQATATNWADRRNNEPPFVVSAQPARLPQVLKSAQDTGADFVFIDTPPRAEQGAVAAVKAADLVITPCRPAVFDLDTVATTLELVRFHGDKPLLAILNGVPPRGTKGEQAGDVLKELGIAVCPAGFGYRAAFADAGALGMTAQEYDAAGKAAQEIEQVYQYVSELVNQPTSEGVNNGPESRPAQRHAAQR